MSDRARPQWLIPAGIGLLVVVLVVVALIREPLQLDPTTPEGAVQEYLQSISDNDFQRALEILDPEEFTDCVAADVARYAPSEPFTANLEGNDGGGRDPSEDMATVSVRMRFGTDGILGSGWETWEVFSLVSRDGLWWITDDPWPHFIWECRERGDL